nr:MAG TPA: hypothetical protein [Caudoviricetes sp.]
MTLLKSCYKIHTKLGKHNQKKGDEYHGRSYYYI